MNLSQQCIFCGPNCAALLKGRRQKDLMRESGTGYLSFRTWYKMEMWGPSFKIIKNLKTVMAEQNKV
jgi:hypothetical protein